MSGQKCSAATTLRNTMGIRPEESRSVMAVRANKFQTIEVIQIVVVDIIPKTRFVVVVVGFNWPWL